MIDTISYDGQEWYDRKSAMMEQILGKEHEMVLHSMISYALGGRLDLYYYPNGIPGTAIATKELSEQPGEGPSNRVFQNYELVMFTKHPIDLDAGKESSFGRMNALIESILNVIAPFSSEASLNPKDTCEFPEDEPHIGGRCVIFDAYPSISDEKKN